MSAKREACHREENTSKERRRRSADGKNRNKATRKHYVSMESMGSQRARSGSRWLLWRASGAGSLMDTSTSTLIAFQRGEGPDHQGQRIDDVWGLSHFWMEHTHDYIQWLFPIPEAGRYNGFAPVLDDKSREAFAGDPVMRASQRKSLDVMLNFFGLSRTEFGIAARDDLDMREHIWLKRGGHNHLRISRIIRSLHLCHQQALAATFREAVIEIGTTQGIVSEQSIQYWRTATDGRSSTFLTDTVTPRVLHGRDSMTQ